MTDPLVMNGPMPSEEYARYSTFWSRAIRASFVFVAGTVLVVLLALGVWTSRVLTELQKVRQAIERQTDLMTGGRAS